jgi:hypothetical protein
LKSPGASEPFLTSLPWTALFLMSLLWIELFLIWPEPILAAAYALPPSRTNRQIVETTLA